MKILKVFGSIVMIFTIVFAANVYTIAAPGNLDPTFGNAGTVSINSPSSSTTYRGVREFSDGQLLVFGGDNYLVAKKYTASGVAVFYYGLFPFPDPNALNPPYVPGRIYDAEILPSGEVFFAGEAKETARGDYRPAIWKFRADGALDQTFGTDGRIFLSSAEGEATQVEFHNTKIYVLYGVEGGRYVTRRHATGLSDLSFGTLGQTSVPATASKETGGMIISPNTKIYIAGGTLLRLNSNGSLDNTFGMFGSAPMPVYNNCPGLGNPVTSYGVTSVAFGAGGALMASGVSAVVDSNGVLIAFSGISRHLENGSIDLSFNNGQIGCGGGQLGAVFPSVATQTDGKAFIAGPVVSRFNVDGTKDTSYPSVNPYPTDILVQTLDGKNVILYDHELHRRLP